MNKKRALRIILPIIILLGIVGTLWAVLASRFNDADGMTVSGTIEAQSAVLSPEVGGRVAVINVDEGDAVSAGDALFAIDETLLQAQYDVTASTLLTAQKAEQTALAAANSAQLNYEMAAAAARQESAAVRASDWSTQNPEGYTLPGGSFTAAEQIQAAQNALSAALTAQEEAQRDLQVLVEDPQNAEFVEVENTLLETRFEVLSFRDVLTKASSAGNDDLREEAQSAYDDALDRLYQVQEDYDDLKDKDGSAAILAARTLLVAAEERVQAAQMRLAALQTGENSLKVLAANAVYAQALAAADQAAQAVAQAQASLDLLDTQISKLTVTAPTDGIILSRLVELGEVLSPGAPALQLGELDPLTITVYVPESELGGLALEQTAILAVDSFPGETFNAVITHIADQAEFTPRNVQTVEGRKSTVFAVKLQVANPDGRLKPGMPADVTFEK